jgi:hypothetical protein
MSFSSANIDFQNRYNLNNLANGVDGGDSVAMRQLTPLIADIQATTTSLANYVKTADFPAAFGAAVTNSNIQNKTQVDAAIAAALMGLPEPESRLASVAVKTVFTGALSGLTAAILAGFGLTPSDAGNIDDANATCVLVDSPSAGETGLYQLRTNGELQKLNAALFTANLGYYSRFYVIDSSREFAIRSIDAAAAAMEIEEIPYHDEYSGLGPIVVSNVNKTINFKFNANDFVMGSETEGFCLHPAIRSSLALIPGLQSSIASLAALLDTVNASLSEYMAEMTARVALLTGESAFHGMSISALQGYVQGIVNKLDSSFANVQEILFVSGAAQIRNAQGAWVPAPSTLVQAVSGDANNGIYRINHNRGILTIPHYFRANQLGEAMQACFLFNTSAVTKDMVEIQVEKYAPVLLVLPAGLTPSAFSSYSL